MKLKVTKGLYRKSKVITKFCALWQRFYVLSAVKGMVIKMRKKFAVIGALILIVCVSVMCVQAYGSKNNDTEAIEQRFRTFGVINDGVFQEDGTITRSNMAEIVGRLQGYTAPVNKSSEECFNDVDQSHPDYVWILMCKNNGWANGDENGNFNPDRTVTEIEAATMLIKSNIGGFDEVIRLFGGYPNGYKAVADMTGMTRETGTLTESIIKKDKLLFLINRFVEVPMLGVSHTDDGTPVIEYNFGPVLELQRLASRNIADPFAE